MTTWVILTTAPLTEFRARDEMIELGIAALVPVEFRMRQWAKVKRFTRKTVLPGYLFALIGPADWAAVRAIDGVRLPLRSDGRWATLTPSQVLALETLSQPAQQGQIDHNYRLGDLIRIRRGAMAELEAVIASLDGGQIVAVVSMFGKEHRVQVAPEHVGAT
jgi:transcription antitermination factor NusG